MTVSLTRAEPRCGSRPGELGTADETPENADCFLREHPQVAGAAISIPEAIEAGRVVFGDLLPGD